MNAAEYSELCTQLVVGLGHDVEQVMRVELEPGRYTVTELGNTELNERVVSVYDNEGKLEDSYTYRDLEARDLREIVKQFNDDLDRLKAGHD